MKKEITIQLIQADVKEGLKQIPDETVQMCITSPPYYALRDYGVEGQLGLEPTVEEYVEKLTDIFEEMKRTLRTDGTFWLNLGDSYNGSGGEHTKEGGQSGLGIKNRESKVGKIGRKYMSNLKPKDLMGVPWRAAFSLQDAGWWLRQDIIWAKGISFCDAYSGSTMPESVRDRFCKSHEYIFLLTKNDRYFFDLEAVKEGDAVYTRKAGGYQDEKGTVHPGRRTQEDYRNQGGIADKDTTTIGRTPRSVWAISPRPFPDAHFAVFPPELVRPAIKAGTSDDGSCIVCGTPRLRIIEREIIGDLEDKPYQHNGQLRSNQSKAGHGTHHSTLGGQQHKVKQTEIGWKAGCNHNLEIIPCTVLDTFNGSGTTGVVALQECRNYIGIDINEKYLDMTEKRIIEVHKQMGNRAPGVKLIRTINGRDISQMNLPIGLLASGKLKFLRGK